MIPKSIVAMISSATKDSKKGAAAAKPVFFGMSSGPRQPCAAIHGLASAMYQSAPNSHAAIAATSTDRAFRFDRIAASICFPLDGFIAWDRPRAARHLCA
jgi:hypothetical protein